ncbi:hypothetical protein [Mesorhizobium sp. B2-1-8]|uniref:hypothetical protein n=1 Tax=Mesorhizobium sp. B2-1-8 TaxID=2589967 RepID=UPI0039EF1965
MALAARMLLGREGAFPFPNTGGTYRNLLKTHQLNPIGSEEEIAFVVGHLNGWKERSIGIIGAIATLAPLAGADYVDALSALSYFAVEWGASNYLAKKTAYIMARGSENRTDELTAQFSHLSEIVDQRKHPGPYFTALESIDIEFPYFPAMSTRVQGYQKYAKGDFRQLLHLNNIIPSPVCMSDVGPFLRKSHAMSLVDEVVGILQLMHIGEAWPGISSTIKLTMDPELFVAFCDFQKSAFDPLALYNDVGPEDADFTYYRRSIAFLEFSKPARYRHFVDRVLASRLLPGFFDSEDSLLGYPQPTSKDLNKGLVGFRSPMDYENFQNSGIFMRTIFFLIYMKTSSQAHNLNSHELRFILEHTQSLDVLLAEQEIERLYAFCDEASRPLVTVLALALYKSRAVDEDVDFKFRLSLSNTVLEKFSGSVEKFIEWLLVSTPNIANFLLVTLDRPTLQKLYWVISSADQADIVRQSILRLVGRALERIDYLIEADAIEAQRQVSKLRKYFDDSRIYIDGFGMKKWLIENPNAYTQEYARVIEHEIKTIQATTIVIGPSGIQTGTAEIPANNAFDYVLMEVVKYAFAQFCLNTNFGIESYLGRRIRHNTLMGTMLGGVDSIIERPHFQALAIDYDFVEANDNWVESYRSLVKHMRLDLLQFKSPNKSRGIFSAEIKDEDEITRINLIQLRLSAIAGRSYEIFLDLLIRFCWIEIEPQLASASKVITVDILHQAQASMDEHLGGFTGELHRQYRTELWNAVYERFTRLALLWQFRFEGVCGQLLTVRTSAGWRSREEVENGLSNSWHARLWRWSADSFFFVPLL